MPNFFPNIVFPKFNDFFNKFEHFSPSFLQSWVLSAFYFLSVVVLTKVVNQLFLKLFLEVLIKPCYLFLKTFAAMLNNLSDKNNPCTIPETGFTPVLFHIKQGAKDIVDAQSGEENMLFFTTCTLYFPTKQILHINRYNGLGALETS